MALLDDLDHRRERDMQTRENSARLAQVFATFDTVGQGSQQYEERVDFGLVFIDRPTVSYGSELDVDDLADVLDIEDTDDAVLPLCSGYVVNWDQDERGFYTGCWVAVRVFFPTYSGATDNVDPQAAVEMQHHFTFAAIGLKDIPLDVDDAGEE